MSFHATSLSVCISSVDSEQVSLPADRAAVADSACFFLPLCFFQAGLLLHESAGTANRQRWANAHCPQQAQQVRIVSFMRGQHVVVVELPKKSSATAGQQWASVLWWTNAWYQVGYFGDVGWTKCLAKMPDASLIRFPKGNLMTMPCDGINQPLQVPSHKPTDI